MPGSLGDSIDTRQPRAQLVVRVVTLVVTLLALAALQIGLIPLSSSAVVLLLPPSPVKGGTERGTGEALSSDVAGTLVFTSTSIAEPALTATATSTPAAPGVSPVVSVTSRPSPTRRPTRSPTPTASATPTRPAPTHTPARALHLPTIDYFTASRADIYAGDSIALSWDLHGAREAYLLYEGREEGVVAPGGKTFVLAETTVFTLSARNDDGEVHASLLVNVNPATVTPSPTPTELPMPTPDGKTRTADVPILMYHYISKPPRDADAYRLDLSVASGDFEAQLAWLRAQGYQTIHLRDLVYHLTRGWPLPEKPIILTFDDGYRDHYTHAFPLLRQYGYVGTFFLITSVIDSGDPAYLTWDMVKEMHQAGMEMQPHGYHHYDLKGRGNDFLVYEIVGAKEAIEARTGEIVRFFSYPSGSYDDQTIAVLKSAHFWAAVTTIQGTTQSSTDLFELQRLRIHGDTTVDDFARLLRR
jgi:peptidoglycan/xylan/chitin deacetylase (PgdA/CDA1 family)